VLEARAGDDVQAARSGLFGSLQNRLVKKRFAPIERHMPLTPETRWLDIGCGSGLVLNSLREAYGVNGTGIDYSERAVALCRRRGFEAHATRFEDYAPGSDEAYDVVHSSHLIEHIASPYEYMKACYELVRPGGINVFFTPNIDTWEARRFGRHWGGLHVPRHWTLLDAGSAKKLGERAGFEHLETHFSTNGIFWTWSFHSLLVERFGRATADRLFPSDHRAIESTLVNVLRTGVLSVVDTLNVALRRQSSNMLVIFRRPAERG
jgi:SAM-dependent methyltransferase